MTVYNHIIPDASRPPIGNDREKQRNSKVIAAKRDGGSRVGEIGAEFVRIAGIVPAADRIVSPVAYLHVGYSPVSFSVSPKGTHNLGAGLDPLDTSTYGNLSAAMPTGPGDCYTRTND